jgi:hypothetical protein
MSELVGYLFLLNFGFRLIAYLGLRFIKSWLINIGGELSFGRNVVFSLVPENIHFLFSSSFHLYLLSFVVFYVNVIIKSTG